MTEEYVCPHDHVEKDDDGQSSSWFFCRNCLDTVVLTEPDEDGISYWEVVS